MVKIMVSGSEKNVIKLFSSSEKYHFYSFFPQTNFAPMNILCSDNFSV